MNQTQELAISVPANGTLSRRPQGLELRTLDDMWQFSQIIAKSGLAPRGMETVEKIFLAVQMGAELSLSPMMALQNIGVINGKPGVYGDAALALVRQSGLLEAFRETFEGAENSDDYAAVCIVKRKGFEQSETRFSVRDAKKAQLWGKSGPWAQYPGRMLRFRARGFALRDEFADVLKGFKTTEELGDYEDASPVIAVSVAPQVAGMPEAEVVGTGEAILPEDVPDWFAKFLLALKGTPGANEAGLNKRVATATKNDYPTLSDFLASVPLPTVKALLQRAEQYGKKKRADAAPTPLQGAVRQVVEAAKQGNPEEEKASEQEDPKPITEAQQRAIAALGARLFGRETRDKDTLDLLRDEFGYTSTLDNISAKQASEFIELMNAKHAEAQEKAGEEFDAKPAKPKKNPNMARLMAIIAAKGLSMDEVDKPTRLVAVNAFLDEQGIEAVTSFSELSGSTIHLLAGAIEDGLVMWGTPSIVEGDVTDGGAE